MDIYTAMHKATVYSEHNLNRYIKFIDSIPKDRVLEYKEEHHILPKALFPEYIKEKWNLINLTPREHFIAHWMLARIYSSKMNCDCYGTTTHP